MCCAAKRVFRGMRRGLSVVRGGVRNAPKHRWRALFHGNATNALARRTDQQILAEKRGGVRVAAPPVVQCVLLR